MKKTYLISLSVVILAAIFFLACGKGGSDIVANKNNNNLGNNPSPSPSPTTYDGFGYDNNANGVWDDLDKYISNQYPNNIPMQKALMQMSKALEAGVKAGAAKDDAAAQNARAALSKANYCLLERTGNAEAMDEEGSLLDVEMLKGGANRSTAYQEFNSLLSGGFYGSDQNVPNPCE